MLVATATLQHLDIAARPDVVTIVSLTPQSDECEDFVQIFIVPANALGTFGGPQGLERLRSVGQPLWPKAFYEFELGQATGTPSWRLYYARRSGAVGDVNLFIQIWEEKKAE